MRAPLLVLGICLSCLLAVAPFSSADLVDTGGQDFETCGGVATAQVSCSTGAHQRGGIDAAYAHGPYPLPQPGYTGTIMSRVTWGGGPDRVWCDIQNGVTLQCGASGAPPPLGTVFLHECFSLTLGFHDNEESHRGGSGPWSCAVEHSTFPCGGNPLCRVA